MPRRIQGNACTKILRNTEGGKDCQQNTPHCLCLKTDIQIRGKYKPFLLEFAGLKFTLDKFNNIIWGSPVKIETNCQALRDVLLSYNLNTTHARWRDSVLAHQIVDVQHEPGKINIVRDGLSHKDEMNHHRNGDGSSWTVPPNWENTQGLEYNLFITDIAPNTLHS